MESGLVRDAQQTKQCVSHVIVADVTSVKRADP
jgi:hypothetical protein